jgi:hypothetical protein
MPGPIWVWSANRDFLPVAGTETFAPGETKTYTVQWDGNGPTGQAAGPGLYAAIGFMTGRPVVQARMVSLVVMRP